MPKHSPKIMTLDAGGTNFVFSALQNGIFITPSFTLPARANQLNQCLNTIIAGFQQIEQQIGKADAISFAFPGPADYTHGIIGNLPNFPAFQGEVALGPLLENTFHIPVFINNDGNLFAYGEALAGALPQINADLVQAQNNQQYHNLLGLTLGTGFGAGVVLNKQLLFGDNGCGGDIWCFRNKKHPACIVEESVSIRAVKRVYKNLSGDSSVLTPKEIFEIAEGQKKGDIQAAQQAFTELGEIAGDAIASVITIIDGLIVIGGGISGANKYILPAITKELNSSLQCLNGNSVPRIQMKAFNLDNTSEYNAFLQPTSKSVTIPFSREKVQYNSQHNIGVISSKLGTNQAVSLGAYYFALHQLNIIEENKTK